MPHPTDRVISRRAFFGGGRALAIDPDDAGWADVEARAARAGIVPGTRVDASGAPLASPRFGMEPFLGEIMIVAFNYAPRGWVLCNGQILPINGNQALFSLLGTTYGGNGVTTFALPDLQGRIPMHAGSTYPLGTMDGSETVTLTAAQMPTHTHLLGTAATATATSPTNAYYAPSAPGNAYATGVPLDAMNSSVVGQGQPVTNLPPYLVLNYCIALQGVFPSRP